MEFTRIRCDLCALPFTVIRQGETKKHGRPTLPRSAPVVARFDRGLWSKLCKHQGDGTDPQTCPNLGAVIVGPRQAAPLYAWRFGRR